MAHEYQVSKHLMMKFFKSAQLVCVVAPIATLILYKSLIDFINHPIYTCCSLFYQIFTLSNCLVYPFAFMNVKKSDVGGLDPTSVHTNVNYSYISFGDFNAY